MFLGKNYSYDSHAKRKSQAKISHNFVWRNGAKIQQLNCEKRYKTQKPNDKEPVQSLQQPFLFVVTVIGDFQYGLA